MLEDCCRSERGEGQKEGRDGKRWKVTGEEMGECVRQERREIGERGVEVLEEKTGGSKGETDREKETEGDGKSGAECGKRGRRNGRWMEGGSRQNVSSRGE